MPIVLRPLGSMFDAQPRIGAPEEVHQMTALLQATPVARAVSTMRSAPLQFVGPGPTSFTQSLRSDGTIGAAPQDGTSSSIASPCIYGVTPGCRRSVAGAGIDQPYPLVQDTTAAQDNTQDPTYASLPAPDQIPPRDGGEIIHSSPGGDVALPGGRQPSHGFNLGLALGIAALFGLGVVGIVAVSRG